MTEKCKSVYDGGKVVKRYVLESELNADSRGFVRFLRKIVNFTLFDNIVHPMLNIQR